GERQRSRARAGRAEADRRRRPGDQREARAGARSGGESASVGRRVRLHRRQTLAVPVASVHRQRESEERPGLGRSGGNGRRFQRLRHSFARGDSAMIYRRALGALLTFSALVASATLAHAALDATDTTWDGGTPPQGVYFHWYEPSFYTGFAPRTQDPARLHIHLS